MSIARERFPPSVQQRPTRRAGASCAVLSPRTLVGCHDGSGRVVLRVRPNVGTVPAGNPNMHAYTRQASLAAHLQPPISDPRIRRNTGLIMDDWNVLARDSHVRFDPSLAQSSSRALFSFRKYE